MRPGRIVAGGLAALLALQPAVVAAAELSSYDRIYARYLRGEASLGEMEAARRAFDRASIDQSRLQVAPAPRAPEEAAPVPVPVPLAETGEAGLGAKLRNIGAWIRDIPARTVRRWGPEKAGFATATEAESFIEGAKVPAYTANAAQREADSTWVRPVKVTAQAEVNKVQAVIERVVAFGGLSALAKAASGDAAAKQVISQATKVVNKMSPVQRQQLAAGLSTGGFGRAFSTFIKGKPTSMMGRIIKDDFGNNILLAVAASGIVSAFLNDGLDLDTLKDHLVALNAINADRSRRENLLLQPLEAVAYFHMDKGVSKAWTGLWSKATSGGGRFAQMLTNADAALVQAGEKFVKAPPPALAQKAADFSRQAASLGLPGVSGATALSLQGAAEAVFKAGTLGLIGMPLIYTGWRAVAGFSEGHFIGGGRERIFARYDLFDTYFQRTGNKWRDAMEERKVAVTNLWENYEKFPFTNALDYFFRFVGGFAGAVVASSIVAPVGIGSFAISLIVSAIFAEGGVAIGKWLGAKLDTSGRFYRRLRRKNTEDIFELELSHGNPTRARQEALDALRDLDRYRATLGVRTKADLGRVLASGGSSAARMAELARAYSTKKRAFVAETAQRANSRAQDYEKLMKVSQVNSRIYFVRSFDDVKLVRKGGYIQMEFPGFSGVASPRYDLVTAEGRRGIWDYKTNRVIDVGRVQENNGKRITFLDDEGVQIRAGALVLKDKSELEQDAGNVFVSKNGIVLEKGPTGEWLVRGYGGEYDIVLRGSGRRFEWNGSEFLEVGSPRQMTAKVAAEEAVPEDAKEAEQAAKKKADAETAAAKARSFDAKTMHKLAKQVVGDPTDHPADAKLISAALSDLGRLHKASGASLAERFGTGILSR